MTIPGAYPPAQEGRGSQSVVIAATPGEALAETLAAELRNLGWRAAVAEQVEPYAREARACVALIAPTSLNDPALAAALATRAAPLIPLVVGATPLPPGPWATPPIAFSGDPAQTARDIVTAASGQAAAPAGGYAAPSQPLQPYQDSQTYSTQPTQAGYTQYPQGDAPYAQPAAPKKRRWPVIVGGVLAAALLVCVIGGVVAYAGLKPLVGAVSTGVSQTATAQASDPATATPVATDMPSIPANFTVFTDSSAGYKIAYPSDWTKHASSPDIIFLDTIAPADLVVGSVNANIPQSDVASTESQFFKSAAGSGSYNNLQGPTTVTHAGERWTQESADISSAGQSLHGVVLVANHGSHAYIIGYLGDKSAFDTLDAQYFQPMLQSFAFLG